MARKVYKYYLIYKITNLKNQKIYIGMHRTNDLEDGYMGSGKRIRRSIQYHGIENFKKEILFQCENEDEMVAKEIELVNEDFIKRKDTYNLILGGHGSWSYHYNKITVKDLQGNIFKVNNNDIRYISGELVGITKGKITVKDKGGKTYHVDVNDPRYVSGELVAYNKNKVPVVDKDGKIILIDTTDKRYLSGELKFNWTGRKHTEDSKAKMRESHKGAQKGKKNSQYGTMWITDGKDNKKIRKEDNIPEGWTKGRNIK